MYRIPLTNVDLGVQLVLEYAGPDSEVRIERISRDCFRDGGALAEVIAFYKAKSEKDAVKVEEVDPGLEVDPLLILLTHFTSSTFQSFLLCSELL